MSPAPPLAFAEERDKAMYLNIAAFWYHVAKGKHEGTAFMNTLTGGFFSHFPEEYFADIEERIDHIKLRIDVHMNWAVKATRIIHPTLPWNVLFALPRWQYQVLGRKLLRDLKDMQKEAISQGKPQHRIVKLALVNNEPDFEVICNDAMDSGDESEVEVINNPNGSETMQQVPPVVEVINVSSDDEEHGDDKSNGGDSDGENDDTHNSNGHNSDNANYDADSDDDSLQEVDADSEDDMAVDQIPVISDKQIAALLAFDLM
ncbi:hypothetical protein DFP72DRAFT_1063836 [Ephemerocybe angulata]|uniref:Uncharacterized protein n=1 Tax=Ephemerocybe angulata TaxID=980116 RepID=A0A8H6M876_9AGAR|nr:hypothetical protein DFP72DRAFT_1063836 [Tulosesus angulatus]